jgi:hypothetical protein
MVRHGRAQDEVLCLLDEALANIVLLQFDYLRNSPHQWRILFKS